MKSLSLLQLSSLPLPTFCTKRPNLLQLPPYHCLLLARSFLVSYNYPSFGCLPNPHRTHDPLLVPLCSTYLGLQDLLRQSHDPHQRRHTSSYVLTSRSKIRSLLFVSRLVSPNPFLRQIHSTFFTTYTDRPLFPSILQTIKSSSSSTQTLHAFILPKTSSQRDWLSHSSTRQPSICYSIFYRPKSQPRHLSTHFTARPYSYISQSI